jgi:fibronectin-binding autotransporter adhesin
LTSTSNTTTKQVLTITGTAAFDSIYVTLTPDKTSIHVSMSGIDMGTYQLSQVSRIAINGDAGDDYISVDAGIKLDAILSGGAGNDEVHAGGGSSILLGGDGADKLYGGTARNVMIGGAGADLLVGGKLDDILIGGTTAHDNNDTALLAIMAEWTSTHDFTTRLRNLQGISHPKFSSRLNGTTYLKPSGASKTVFDDAAKDTLQGSTGRNWYIVTQNTKNTALNDAILGLLSTDMKSKIV